jgi:hypothetical protein
LNNDHWLDIGVASYGSSNVDVLLHTCWLEFFFYYLYINIS